jgi:hypothetical protein
MARFAKRQAAEFSKPTDPPSQGGSYEDIKQELLGLSIGLSRIDEIIDTMKSGKPDKQTTKSGS